jgi:crossover junction endodeoxyribonuclease RuvC
MGVVDADAGRAVRLVSVQVVATPADQDIALRLQTIHRAAVDLIRAARPDVVAVERVFTQSNVRTATGTAQAAGVVLLAAAEHALPVALHTPSEVKAAVTGNGRADKAQVTDMVTRLLRLPQRPRPADAADALALAICHAWRAPLIRKLKEASA